MNCFISNCVDGNDYINYKAVMIVKQPTHLMVPLKLEGTRGFPGWPVIKNPPANHEMQVHSLGQEKIL